MDEQSILSATEQRTRRNMIKMGAIAASAIVASLASVKSGLAGPGPGPGPGRRRGPGGPHCFLRGTTILTADGGRRIEDLAIGDLLPTVFGGIRPIQWSHIIHSRRAIRHGPGWRRRCQFGSPARRSGGMFRYADLYVTGWHALLVDGLLVPACCLINGTTIRRHTAREEEELEFFHIKFESHDAIYAEGAPIETLLGVDERAVNFAEYFRLYGGATDGCKFWPVPQPDRPYFLSPPKRPRPVERSGPPRVIRSPETRGTSPGFRLDRP